jgi:GNAT superfamily N-acetyltransferase
MEIRTIAAADWRTLRETRLAALADSPEAFSGTLMEALALPDDEWRRRAAPGAGSQGFAAVSDGAWIGMCAVLEQDPVPQLVSVWVHPEHRGRGVGSALSSAAVAWCRRRGHATVIVWVNAANAVAIHTYEKVGFRPTGESKPFPGRPELTEIAMALPAPTPG